MPGLAGHSPNYRGVKIVTGLQQTKAGDAFEQQAEHERDRQIYGVARDLQQLRDARRDRVESRLVLARAKCLAFRCHAIIGELA